MSLVRMALEQRRKGGGRFWRTAAAVTLDPTEKGAVNYFLGMTFCKLFAAKLLGTPWLLHLDVFRPALNTVLTSRSRPDLVGEEHGSGRWHSFECKGRVSPPGNDVKAKAKAQANRLVSVNGINCTLHIGAITFFKDETIRFFWRDPDPGDLDRIELSVPQDVWEHYYSPTVQLVADTANRDAILSEQNASVAVEAGDVEIGMHSSVASLLFEERWGDARLAAIVARAEIEASGFQPDGLRVREGATWRDRLEGEG